MPIKSKVTRKRDKKSKSDKMNTEIPIEWRVAVGEVPAYVRPFPDGIPDESPKENSYQEILENDNSLQNVPIKLDKTEKLLETANYLKQQIIECKSQLQLAEEKRMVIVACAELIHGECDSQLAAEQQLDIFVRSIDSILHYFDDLEKITIDFKSPIYSVLSPDFSTNLKIIEDGLRFFEVNPRFKESRNYYVRYQSMQTKITDLIKDYIGSTFNRISTLIMLNKKYDEQYKNDIYVKFIRDSNRIMRLYKMCEKTPLFADILSIYSDTRIKLLTPILSMPICDITDIRPRASTILSFCYKEYDLCQNFFKIDDHPAYGRCFSNLVSSIGLLFYQSCVSTLLKTNDVKQLCNACIVLRGDVLQEEISRVPVAAEKLRKHFSTLLSDAQERLLFRIELSTQEITNDAQEASTRTIDALSMLYYALPPETFGEVACQLLTACLQTIITESKKFKDDPIESDSYLLGHLLILGDQLSHFDTQIVGTTQTIDFEPVTEYLSRLLRFDSTAYQLKGERGLLYSVANMTRVVSSTVDARKNLESQTSLTFKSLTSNATQMLVQPLVNLIARQGKEKKQILSAVEGVKTIVGEHFKNGISAKVTLHIKNKDHLNAVLEVLKTELLKVLNEFIKSVGEVDEETKSQLDSLLAMFNELSF